MYIFDENKFLHFRTPYFCIVTELLEIVTLLSAIETDCWRPRQENFLHSDAFLFNKESDIVENTSNLERLRKSRNEFNFFQPRKIDLWQKMRTAIGIIGTGILIKELEEIKV